MASMASPTTALVFFGSLGLRLISEGGGVVRFSLVFVFGDLILGLLVGVFLVFLCRWAMAFWARGINFPNIEGWLQVSLCFYVTYLLHHFFPRFEVSPSVVQLGPDGRT